MTSNRLSMIIGVACAAAVSFAVASMAQSKAAPAADASKRVGDPYAFDTCPISGKKLTEKGEPVVKVIDGREVRFCCGMCPAAFEKNSAAEFKKLDERIIKDQGPLYPLTTSVVTGKALPEKPYEFVYGNRLIRVGSEAEKAEFNKDAKKYLAELDKAVIAKQGADYPLVMCPVSKEKLGSMGKPVDVVVAGRLVRICCNDCRADLDKNAPANVAAVDEARKAPAKKSDAPAQPKK